jgi:hypothetical protein
LKIKHLDALTAILRIFRKQRDIVCDVCGVCVCVLLLLLLFKIAVVVVVVEIKALIFNDLRILQMPLQGSSPAQYLKSWMTATSTGATS